jgi:hypothetical protein
MMGLLDLSLSGSYPFLNQTRLLLEMLALMARLAWHASGNFSLVEVCLFVSPPIPKTGL